MAAAESPSAEYATVEDLRNHWSDAPEAEMRQKLFEAEVEVLALYPDIPDRIDAGTLRREVLTLVLCRMVKRAMNPSVLGAQGIESATQATGPFSQTLKFTGTDGAIFLNKADKRLLAPRRAGEEGMAFTIHPGGRR